MEITEAEILIVTRNIWDARVEPYPVIHKPGNKEAVPLEGSMFELAVWLSDSFR